MCVEQSERGDKREKEDIWDWDVITDVGKSQYTLPQTNVCQTCAVGVCVSQLKCLCIVFQRDSES